MNDYQSILEFLSAEIGLNTDSIGLLSIARGISNSMQAASIESTHEFSEKIKSDKLLFQTLIEEIKVPETWFFRDVECFNYIKNHLENFKDNYSSFNPLRILSVPCSTGEEPFSAAMLLMDCGLDKNSVSITACDISINSIKHAKTGYFRNSSFRNEYSGFKEKYFTNDNYGYKLSDEILSIPEFIEDNLVKENFLINQIQYDFIFCKNLLIYLDEEARSKVLANINRLLKDDGALLVGLSEINFFTRHGFEQIKHNMAFACKKIAEPKSQTNIQIQQNKPVINSKSTPKISLKNKPTISRRRSETVLSIPAASENNIETVKKMADTGEFIEAEKICDIILQNEYSNFEALYYMGLIQNALRNSSNAADYFKKVLYLQPDHYESLVHLSLIYEASGENDRANIFRDRAERAFIRMNKSAEEN
ncbi:MAG: hypothetical protein KIT33_13720 [Candidatus Kapabacteria bacterium]|nr:hypothetical protein [Ignavibacteriota bacterium]MCW5886023.1 hypothetical protein [Candidatus Kapabacteria bacterium]